MAEYIIPVDETAKDWDEMFVYVIRKQKKLIRCRDCKYFELNHWEKVDEVPLIVAHEICTKWGDGCKTSANGYCFMAERKEE